MKSLFKVTLLATTMAVALNAPLTFAAETVTKAATEAKAAPATDSKSAFKMTIRNLHMRWVHRWDVTWKTP